VEDLVGDDGDRYGEDRRLVAGRWQLGFGGWVVATLRLGGGKVIATIMNGNLVYSNFTYFSYFKFYSPGHLFLIS
jgi:hypothetical protein